MKGESNDVWEYSSFSDLMMIIACIEVNSQLASLHTELASPLSTLR